MRKTWTEKRIAAKPLDPHHPVALANLDLRAELLADEVGIKHVEMGLFAEMVRCLCLLFPCTLQVRLQVCICTAQQLGLSGCFATLHAVQARPDILCLCASSFCQCAVRAGPACPGAAGALCGRAVAG